jgi:hypothetical protein
LRMRDNECMSDNPLGIAVTTAGLMNCASSTHTVCQAMTVILSDRIVTHTTYALKTLFFRVRVSMVRASEQVQLLNSAIEPACERERGQW